MIRKEPFITYKENDCFYIVQKAFPNYVGMIVTEHPSAEELAFCNIHGYQMWVKFDGSIGGNSIFLEPGWKMKVEDTINSMATWYLENRVVNNAKQYKKWKT